MTFELRGIGTTQPEFSLTQDEALELHTTFCRIDETRARTLRALYRRSGVKRRYSVLFENAGGPIEGRQGLYRPAIDEDDRGPGTAERMALYEVRAPELAKEAASKALEAAGTSSDAITHLVTVSCTGFASPGVDAAIISGLGLPATTERTHVGFMGCHGALNGLRVAHSLMRTSPDAVPLVCAVELCSLHFAYGWDPDMMVANALFADGAAAVVGGEGEAGGDDVWKVQATGSMLMPGSEDAMTWRIGDHGFRMTLSARVPGLIEANLRDWLTQWLGDQGLGLGDIESWAVHPGGPRIVTSVQKSLGLSREQTAVSKEVLSEYGNMSSPTILFILDRLQKQAAPRPCVALAFGPGLVVEATLLT